MVGLLRIPPRLPLTHDWHPQRRSPSNTLATAPRPFPLPLPLVLHAVPVGILDPKLQTKFVSSIVYTVTSLHGQAQGSMPGVKGIQEVTTVKTTVFPPRNRTFHSQMFNVSHLKHHQP